MKRNNIKIQEIYPSQNEKFNTIYIKCHSSDDIAIITSAAKNLPKNTNDNDLPKLVPHIPKQMFERHQGLEKLMWQLRIINKGKLSTNIRLGQLDYIVRAKLKTDSRPWKEVTPLKIPLNITFPDLDEKYYKNDQESDDRVEDPTTGEEYDIPPVMILPIDTEHENASKKNHNSVRQH